MRTQFIAWWFVGLTVAAWAAQAEVLTTLSKASVDQNEPLHLTFELTNGSGDPPDLAPLNRDFHIAHRNTSRSMRSFNGRTTQRTTLTLTLVPRRSGELLIPAIQFGNERSRPLKVSVAPGAGDGSLAPSGLQDYRLPDPVTGQGPPQTYEGYGQPFGGPPPSMPWQDWGGAQGPMGWTGVPGWSAPNGLAPPAMDPAPEVQAWQPEPQPFSPQPRTPDSGSRFWPWLAGIAITGWLFTSILLFRSRAPRRRTRPRRTRAVKAPETQAAPPAPPPPVRPQDLIDAVKTAYLGNDPNAAKVALLHWGESIWPDNPPTNLSRLAARCPTFLQRQILKLDDALYGPNKARYGPDAVRWNDAPVWEHLATSSEGGTDTDLPDTGLAPSKP